MFEAYKIGVKISLINHVSAGLVAMSRDFLKTEGDAAKLQARIKGIQSMAIKGIAMAGLGAGGLALLKGPYEEAKKLAQAQANFSTLNLNATENAEAFGKAATMSHKILGTTITDNVKGIHDLHTAFGDLHHALRSADDFAKYSIAAKIANGGHEVEGLVYGSVKALEHRGGKVINDDATFKRELDLQSRVQFGSKGMVSGKDYLAASQTGKMAYTMMDPEYLYGQFAAYMQAKSGATAGTAAMTAFSSLVGGHMDKKAKGFLSDLGLYQEGFSKSRLGIMNQALQGLSPEDRKTAVASMGGESVIAGGLKDNLAELYSKRPDVFIGQYLAPAIRKRFGMDLSDEQVGLIIAKNFNRNTADFLGSHIVNKSKFEKDAAIFNKAQGFSDAYNTYLKTPAGAEAAASAAWKNFLAVFGSVYLPAITKGLLKLAGALDSLGQWVERNQTLVKGLVYAFAALSGGLMLRGTVLLLTAAFRGLGLALMMQSIGGAAGIARLGLSIGKAGFGLSALGVGLAGLVGWLTGGVIANLINKGLSKANGREETLGGWLYDLTHGEKVKVGAQAKGPQIPVPGSSAAALRDSTQALAAWRQSNFVATRSQQPVQVATAINLDGRKVGEAVSTHQARDAGRPLASNTGLDGSMYLSPVAMR